MKTSCILLLLKVSICLFFAEGFSLVYLQLVFLYIPTVGSQFNGSENLLPLCLSGVFALFLPTLKTPTFSTGLESCLPYCWSFRCICLLGVLTYCFIHHPPWSNLPMWRGSSPVSLLPNSRGTVLPGMLTSFFTHVEWTCLHDGDWSLSPYGQSFCFFFIFEIQLLKPADWLNDYICNNLTFWYLNFLN